MPDQSAADVPGRVLHAVVGHKLPGYFRNAVDAVLSTTSADDVLIVDNASELPALVRDFQHIAATEPRVRLLLRDTNDTSRNGKVGGLYDAYNEVVDYALREGYDYLHIIQHDMQVVWWDESVLQRAREIYDEYPECVNICTLAPSRYTALGGNLEYVKPGLARLQNYGLTDTGLYDLSRWRRHEMRFLDSESAHSRKYLADGLHVFFHPLPTVAFIRHGRRSFAAGGSLAGKSGRPSGSCCAR